MIGPSYSDFIDSIRIASGYEIVAIFILVDGIHRGPVPSCWPRALNICDLRTAIREWDAI